MDFGGPPEMYAGPPEKDERQRRVDELKVEVYESRRALLSRKHAFYWRVRHQNGSVMATSGEGYMDKRDRNHAVDFLWPDLEVVEVEK